ncbi:HAD-superfamily hydrolase, subfamily IIB [Clostridium sp. DL-VIII]|uniref:HAD family hydrolase n=1 Tax=Clostridium sp. DL-VIII TaxID=641107 RepID=UPI00023B0720|nr:HAD family hydrolase [Clostridium sp. DL-VIII]EHJ02113.1 HAD-superfamily hydrolase, subfamily IIB [Clostridium sp. DL-VIII]
MKYFFFDIDGTIKPYNHSIPESTKKTIKRLKELGHVVFLATGRRDNEIKSIMKEIDVEHAICAGGGTVVINNNIENQVFFDKKKLKDILKQCRKYNIIMVSVCKGEYYAPYQGIKFDLYMFLIKALKKIKLFNKIKLVNRAFFTSYINAKFINEEKFLEKPTQKLLFYNYECINEIETIRDFTIYNNGSYVYIEFEFKERGIEYIRKRNNLELEDIIVFGDGKNDIGMFNYAKNSIAMGNACEEVKKLASFITKKDNEDGIEYACKHFNWI